MKQPSLIIADDHPLLLKGLRDFLDEKGYDVLESCPDGNSAYNAIIRHKPSIAILDVEMPAITGLEIADLIRKNKIDTRVILITLHKAPELIRQAKSFNVRGYLLKEFALEEIENCIGEVWKGQTYYSKLPVMSSAEENDILQRLTPSEKKILKLIARGYSTRDIANELFISDRTVEKHRSNMIAKLDLGQRPGGLLLWAKDHFN